jgi:hypothetical protein
MSSALFPEFPPDRPNLFTFARSEGWQDAFLCWILSWAHRTQRKRDGALHAVAIHLLSKLLALHKIDAPEKYKTLEIKPQYKRIDILVLVNADIALLIEDKIHAGVTYDQLRWYLAVIKTDFPKRRLVPIYLKTGNLNTDGAVKDAGFAQFGRHKLLEVLRHGKKKLNVRNDIYDDFLNHLESIRRRGRP